MGANMSNGENNNSSEQQKSDKEQKIVKFYQGIVDRAHKEIEWVRSAYKFLVVSISIIIAIGIWFTYKSSVDYKNELKSHGDLIKNTLISEYKSISKIHKDELNSNFEQLAKEVKSRVDDEFQKENIHQLVEEKAKTRIDQVADSIIEQKINESISPKIIDAENRLNQVTETQQQSSKTLRGLEKKTEFTMIAIAAQTDDREAFDKLSSWSTDSSFPFSDIANKTKIRIRASYGGIATPGYLNIQWKEGIDPEKLDFSVLRKEYDSIPPQYHTSLLKFIWERRDFSKKDRMQFLIDVLTKEKSLTATYYAGKFFSKEASIKWNPFVINPLLNWWKENKNKIEK